MKLSMRFSYRVHKIVEYVKSSGFSFETDELLEMGLQGILRNHYNVFVEWTEDEWRWSQETGQYDSSGSAQM
ncbi:hypothetical protein ACFL0Q_07635, partial [Thermodesulfobacteriota bacterium]